MSKIKDSELVKRGGIEIITAEHFKHFQERLKERHNLDISWEEYQELIDPANNRFKGLIKGLGNNSYGTIEFKGKTLWTILKKDYGTLATVYPADVDNSPENMFRMVFSTRLMPVVEAVWLEIKGELEKFQDKVFQYRTDAFFFYDAHTIHVPIHMMKAEGHLTNVEIALYIKKLIEGDNPNIKIQCVRRTHLQRTPRKIPRTHFERKEYKDFDWKGVEIYLYNTEALLFFNESLEKDVKITKGITQLHIEKVYG